MSSKCLYILLSTIKKYIMDLHDIRLLTSSLYLLHLLPNLCTSISAL